jgi:hypothetical protein
MDLRAADPAAELPLDPGSLEAKAMLASIVATPRVIQRWRPRHRLVLGSAAVAAVAVAVGVVTVGGGGSPAYAVTTQADGSVSVMVRWEQFNDPAGLAAALRAAGVPAVTTTARPDHACGTPADLDRRLQALSQMESDHLPVSENGYLMRPKLFPAGSTVVIASFDNVAKKVHYTSMYLAPKSDTRCAMTDELGQVNYVGPTPYPTFMKMEAPQPTP